MASSTASTTEPSASWLDIPADSDFSLSNIPFGIFSLPPEQQRPCCGTALGNYAIDLALLAEAGLFDDIFPKGRSIFRETTLNSFMAQPRSIWIAVRNRIIKLFSKHNGAFESNLRNAAIHPLSDVTMHLPATIGDYTDFYSSKSHATNVGTMFRGKDNALQPNWLHLPVGYHGRSSTVVVSGTPVRRPCGQLQKDTSDPKEGSTYGPCQLLDFELEVAFFVGGPENKDAPIVSVEQAYDRIFGFSLMNDWSARDIQKWEYVPLGPFTAKNFGTTISPWVVTTMALEPFVVAADEASETAVQQDPVPLDYLQDTARKSCFDVQLEVAIQGTGMDKAETICRSNFRHLYWTAAQQLVHHAVTGCTMKAGDLLGSGTISGSTPDSFGSMLELSWKGTKDVSLGDSGQMRKYIQDGDTVVMRGWAPKKEGHGRVGFGSCSGTVLPAISHKDQEIVEPPVATDRYTDLKLYFYGEQSSSWPNRIALEAKGIQYEKINKKGMESYKSITSTSEVQTLRFHDTWTGKVNCLSQSAAIMEFLEEAFPDSPPLLPVDPLDRAIARQMIDIINSNLPQNSAILLDGENASEGRHEEDTRRITEGLLVVEELIKQRHQMDPNLNPHFCMGGFSPTSVDMILLHHLDDARKLYQIDLDNSFPTLAKIEEACLEHPWFSKTHLQLQFEAD